MSTRPYVAEQPEHVIQKIKIADQLTFYVADNDDPPAEIFLRIKGKAPRRQSRSHCTTSVKQITSVRFGLENTEAQRSRFFSQD
jgi:hypothetical protein